MGAIKTTYKAKCFAGHSPPLQEERAIKFRTPQAILKAETKKSGTQTPYFIEEKKQNEQERKHHMDQPRFAKPDGLCMKAADHDVFIFKTDPGVKAAYNQCGYKR